MLAKIADEQTLSTVVSRDASRFPRSSFSVNGAHVNTHASAASLRDWVRRIADLAGVSPLDYEFVLPGEDAAE